MKSHKYPFWESKSKTIPKTLVFLTILFAGCNIQPLSPISQSSTPSDIETPKPESVYIETPTLELTAKIDSDEGEANNIKSSNTPNPITPDQDILPPVVAPDAGFPENPVKMLRPGNLSRVTSPFLFVANLEPGPNNLVEVELVGEDGRTLLYKIVEIVLVPGYKTGNMIAEIDFEIEGVAEAGRLSVSAKDEFGRPKSLGSIDLIMLSSGYTKSNPFDGLPSPLLIQQPLPNSAIKGGVIFLSGLARTQSLDPLSVTIIGETGKIINSGEITLITTDDPTIKLFVGEISYQLEYTTRIRLVISLPGERIPGIAYISSIELLISP